MVAEYLTSLKVAWDLAKAVKISTDAIEDAELKLQIADLISALAEAKINAAESDEKIAELEKKLQSKSEMEFDGSVYYKKSPSTDSGREGPWCPRCFDSSSKEIRLHSGYSDTWRCSNCDRSFKKHS